MDHRVKYPRSMHLPFSPNTKSKNDRVLSNCDHFKDKMIVITEKMDGENTTIYSNGVTHARSINSNYHPSRDHIRALAGRLYGRFPSSYRICGENLFAVHSVEYKELSSWFQVFNVWDGNKCLSWDDTESFCKLHGLNLVPVLYRGPWNMKLIKELAYEFETSRKDKAEGFVVRLEDEFMMSGFYTSLAKWVRHDHVQTDTHWKHKAIKKNGLKKNW